MKEKVKKDDLVEVRGICMGDRKLKMKELVKFEGNLGNTIII